MIEDNLKDLKWINQLEIKIAPKVIYNYLVKRK